MSYSQQDSRMYCIYETKAKSHEEVIIWHQERLDRDKNKTVEWKLQWKQIDTAETQIAEVEEESRKINFFLNIRHGGYTEEIQTMYDRSSDTPQLEV